MPSLFAREFQGSDTRMARGVSSAISISAQVALGVTLVWMSTVVTTPAIARAPLVAPRLVTAVFVPATVEVEKPAAEPIAKAAEDVKVPEPAPERPPLIAVREFENKALPAPATNEVRPVDVLPRPEPPLPAPPPPAPTVGAFPNAVTVARGPEPVKRIEATGFDSPVVHAAPSKPSQNAVVDGGFNSISAAAQPTQQSRVIRESGFGASESVDRPKTQDPSVLQPAGFSDAKVVEPVRRSESIVKTPTVVPVQILSKPTPAYTSEARRLKVEGEVVLEVEFCASGSVRILRVVRSLGHGLDESAKAAAQQIRFRPATSEGRPVDYRTTVQIVFRLA